MRLEGVSIETEQNYSRIYFAMYLPETTLVPKD